MKKILVGLLTLISVLSFAQSENSELSEIRKELQGIEKFCDNNPSIAPITIEKIGSEELSQKGFEGFIASKAGLPHALNYTEFFNGAFYQYINKINETHIEMNGGDPELISALLKMIDNAHGKGIINHFYAAEVAERVWTSFSYRYYFALSTSKGYIIFKLRSWE